MRNKLKMPSKLHYVMHSMLEDVWIVNPLSAKFDKYTSKISVLDIKDILNYHEDDKDGTKEVSAIIKLKNSGFLAVMGVWNNEYSAARGLISDRLDTLIWYGLDNEDRAKLSLVSA